MSVANCGGKIYVIIVKSWEVKGCSLLMNLEQQIQCMNIWMKIYDKGPKKGKLALKLLLNYKELWNQSGTKKDMVTWNQLWLWLNICFAIYFHFWRSERIYCFGLRMIHSVQIISANMLTQQTCLINKASISGYLFPNIRNEWKFLQILKICKYWSIAQYSITISISLALNQKRITCMYSV